MNKILSMAVLPILASDCISIIPDSGTVTGYTLNNDSAKAKIETGYHKLWKNIHSTITELHRMILESDESKGMINADISGRNITVRINSFSNSTQELKVCARKYILPKPHFAQKIFCSIVKELR